MRYFLLIFIVSLGINSSAQIPFVKEKRDYIWLMGYASDANTQFFGGTHFDFNYSPFQLSEQYLYLNFDITNASICDTVGNLLFYTNGIEIHNVFGELIENGDGLNPDPYTQQWIDYGYNLFQGALSLQYPDNTNQYFLIHSEKTIFPEGIYGNYHIVARLYYSTIDMGAPEGNVIEKNELLVGDTLDFGKITANRHANGRDWWILQQEYFSNRFYLIKISPTGISVENNQVVGEETPSGLGQAVFSPDGSTYATYSAHDVESGQFINIYSFDRCTGTLAIIVQINEPSFVLSGGIAISPNSRFLYVSSYVNIYQYDLWADDIEASRETVAVYDGVLSPPPFSLPTRFFLCQLAPDGKIYISSTNTVRVLHVIHNPNAKGAACMVEQRGVELPTFNAFGIPNHPYYGLGPEDGSPCDTLGIDHYPKADFRHNEQFLTASFWDYSLFFPTHWSWDFGDDSPGSTERDPVHTYTEPGAYYVCLTVANENASDTYCDWVNVTVSDTENHHPEEVPVKLYPNPAIDYIILEPQVPLPPGTHWSIYDAMGRQLRRKAMPAGQPQLLLNLEGLAAGLYHIRLEAEERQIWQGKFVKSF